MDIQRELIGNQQKYKLYDSSIMMAKKNMERCKITMKEIDGLSENNRTYSALGTFFLYCFQLETFIKGRAFFYQDKNEIMNLLGNQITNNEKEINELEVILVLNI